MTLRIQLKVIPLSGKSLCIIDKQQKVRCYLKAQPQDGKANQELIAYLAHLCKVTKKDVEIIAGLTSRSKVVLIATDRTYDQFLQILGFDKQGTLF